MKSKLKNASWTLVAIAFWLILWQILSLIVGNSYLLPNVPKTFSSLIEIFISESFFKTVFSTLLRVVAGLLLGILAGTILAIISKSYNAVCRIITPFITVIKSTPVATFIILLWVMLSGNALTIVIAFLMVMPIIFQNLLDGFNAISSELSEVCDVFEFSFIKRMRLLVFPTLMNYLIPAIITATGLAWKSEIAAEIIGYTKNSIGEFINNSKQNYDTASVFAWTVVIIAMSVCLEKLTRYLLKKAKERSFSI